MFTKPIKCGTKRNISCYNALYQDNRQSSISNNLRMVFSLCTAVLRYKGKNKNSFKFIVNFFLTLLTTFSVYCQGEQKARLIHTYLKTQKDRKA